MFSFSSMIYFTLATQTAPVLPPTCSLDGWCPSTSGLRSCRGDDSLPSTPVFLVNQSDLHSIQAQSEEDWLQERRKEIQETISNAMLPHRCESYGRLTFHHLTIDAGYEKNQALCNFIVFPLHFMFSRLSFVVRNLQLGPHAGTAPISVRRSYCTAAYREESRLPCGRTSFKEKLQKNTRAKIAEILKAFRQ